MMNPKWFYHSADLDGKCSGAIVKRAIPEVELGGYDYGNEFPWDDVRGRDVIMVDVSLQPFKQMLKLERKAKSLLWIDHHKSAIDDFHLAFGMGDQYPKMEAKLEVGKAACELAWEHFNPGTTMPRAVYMLGRYDVWDHSDKAVLPFQYGMRQQANSPEMPLWESLFDNDVEEEVRICRSGATILSYQGRQYAGHVKTRGFDTELDGLRCIACNYGPCNSQLFDSVWDPERYDAMLVFCRLKSKQWTVSLYSDKPDVDVSVVAKAHGGGGHKGAAGFQCTELPFVY